MADPFAAALLGDDYGLEPEAPAALPIAPDIARFVPTYAIAQEQRDDEAEEWQRGQRERVAQQWADAQRADLAQMTGDADRGIGEPGRMPEYISPGRGEPSLMDRLQTVAANMRPEGGGRPEDVLDFGGALVSEAASNVGREVGTDEQGPVIGGLTELAITGPGKLPAGAKAIASNVAEETARLRLDKFPEQLRQTILDAAKDVGFAVDQRRGVIPDQAAEGLADTVSASRSLEQWIGTKAGTAFNSEEARAVRNAVTAQGAKVDDAAGALAEARSAGTATDNALLAFEAETEKLRGLVAVAEGAKAEAGRSMRAYQALTRPVDMAPGEAMARIVQKYGSKEDALDAVTQYRELVDSGADVLQRAQFWAKVDKPPVKASDWFTLLRYNSMLSSPRSAEVNFVGNFLEVPWRLGRDAVASTVRGRPQEIIPEIKAVYDGFGKGVDAAMQTLAHGITKEQAELGSLPVGISSRIDNPVGKNVARVLEVPGRAMQAGDALAQQVAYGMAAAREAAKAGVPIDALDKAAIKRAGDVMNRMVYKGQMGAIGEWLGAGAQRSPVAANILVPFLRTVYHITARGIDRSPIGAIGTITDVARGAYKPGKELGPGMVPLGERAADNAVGMVTGLWLTNQALGGNISASGPEDTERLNGLKAQGWQPYSVKIGDEWVSYANWGPVAIGLAEAGALGESQLYKKGDDSNLKVGLDVVERLLKLATEQTYLQGIGALWKAKDDPSRYGATWLTQFIGTLVPYGSGINTVGQATETEGGRRPEKIEGDLSNLGENIGQGLEMRFPGLRANVPLNQDVLGRTIPEPMAGGDAFLPLRKSEMRPERVLAEMERLEQAGKSVGVSQLQAEIKGVIKLSPAEQRELQGIYGELVLDVMGRILDDPKYQAAPDGVKAKIMESVDGKLRDAARAKMLTSLPDRDSRITAGVQKKVEALTR